ncbi:MAG TPA: SufD family Fe-S cluster assembly protein [Methanosarcinales archaeon]|nr:SufD family Fe-S cluster assembly protein [Methanosarcinales archaeon]
MREGVSGDAEPDIEKYTLKSEKHDEKDLHTIADEYEKSFLSVGYDPDESERSGSFLQLDHSVMCSKVLQEGVEVMSTTDALLKYPWLSQYWWRAVAAEKDIYTRQVDRKQTHGYFLRTLPGVKTTFPLQSCLFIGQEGLSQNVHNIIIAEEGSELHIITGCSVAHKVRSALHLGVSEFYVKKNAKITFTMIHNWAPEIEVRPRSGIIVEENGVFISNYISMSPVKDLQMYPVVYCRKNARATSQSIVYASDDSKIDIGSKMVLDGENSRAEVVSRSVATDRADVTARGILVGAAPNVKAHLECIGLMLSDVARIHSVPELEATVEDATLSHEAAVGRISEEEIAYLAARGLSEEEAAGAIVRGFLNVDIKGLPAALGEEVRRMIRMSADAL